MNKCISNKTTEQQHANLQIIYHVMMYTSNYQKAYLTDIW